MHMKTQVRGDRNYSLDLLRILSMLMIVSMHGASHGGLSVYSELSSVNGIILRFITVLCGVSVNVFVLISGYFICEQEFRLSRLIKLALQVVFYSWISFFYIAFFRHEGLGGKDYLSLLFPISYANWWFVAAYLGLCFLAPFINLFLSSISKKQHLTLILVLLLLFSILRDLFVGSDPYYIRTGSSMIWFIVVYIISAYIKLYVSVEKARRPFLIYFCISLVTMAIWIVMKLVAVRIKAIDEFQLSGYWTRYNSILNISAAVFLFIAFLKIKINGNSRRLIAAVSSHTFAVYLIHDNPYMKNYIWIDLLRMDTIKDDGAMLLKYFLAVLFVFFACIGIDYIRLMLFQISEKSIRYKKILQWFDRIPAEVSAGVEKTINRGKNQNDKRD